MKIIYLSQFAGFRGGIEHFQFKTASLLRKCGYDVDLAWCERARTPMQFCKAFNRSFTLQEALERKEKYDLAIIHRINDNVLLQKIIDTFPRLAVFEHGHILHCPKQQYSTPLSQSGCHRKYKMFPCACCAFSSPALADETFFRGSLLELFVDFPRRKRLFQSIPLVFVLSQYMRDTLLKNGFRPQQVKLLHPFIQLPPLAPAPRGNSHDSPARILFVGPFTRTKGGEQLLQILQKLHGNFRLTCVGEGPDLNRLKHLVEVDNLKDKVVFRGWQSNLQSIYASHDIMVLPSLAQESFGFVGLEAASYGLPLVAFDQGGCREYLSDSVNGFLIPEKDLDAFTRQLDFLIQNPMERREMGHESRLIAEKYFSRKSFLKNFNRLFSQLNKIYPEPTETTSP